MVYTPQGQLSYGFDLGNQDNYFGFKEDDRPAWTHAENPILAAEEALLASVGYNAEGLIDGSLHEARDKAIAQLGVDLKRYGTEESSWWMLTGLHIATIGSGPADVVQADLTLPERLPQRLSHAANVLKIPGRPRWMLTALCL